MLGGCCIGSLLGPSVVPVELSTRVGCFVKAKSLSIADIFPLVEAEALACLEAINWLRELGYQCAIIEIDCKGVVDGVRGNCTAQSN